MPSGQLAQQLPIGCIAEHHTRAARASASTACRHALATSMHTPAAQQAPDMPAFYRLHNTERQRGALSTPSPPKQSHALPQPAAFAGSARAASAPAGAPHAALHSRVFATAHLQHMHCHHAARLLRQHRACGEHC